MLQTAAIIKNSCAGTLAFWGVKYFFEVGNLVTEIVSGGVRVWGPTLHLCADYALSGALILHRIDPALSSHPSWFPESQDITHY